MDNESNIQGPRENTEKAKSFLNYYKKLEIILSFIMSLTPELWPIQVAFQPE